MTTTRRQMIEAEIKSLQGELTSLIRQKQGFLMATYNEWYTAIENARNKGWTIKSNGDTKIYLTKISRGDITIDLMDTYGYAKCTIGGLAVIKNTPNELAAYIDRYAV
jgi:hypothetical protein